MALADLIVVMNDGRIEQAAHPRTVFERPATAFVARFMGDHNVISGRVTTSANGLVTFDDPRRQFSLSASGEAEPGAPIDIGVRTDRVRHRRCSSPWVSASPASSPTSNIAARP